MQKRRQFLKKGAFSLATYMAFPLSNKAHTYQSNLSRVLPFIPTDTDKETVEKARRNIEQIRKREVELTFLDKEGSPLENQEVSIQQLKHQFLFGDQNWLMATMQRNNMIDNGRGRYYRKRFEEVLNSLNTTVYWTERPRNDGTKTEDFQGDIRLDDFEESVNWANANGLVAKGHPIFWTVPKAIPEWLKKYPIDTMMKFVEVRVRSLCARFKGKIQVWDAVNEMLWETHPKNLSQRTWPYTETMENMVDYIGKVLKWAREEDPDALYCINDYGLGKVNRENLTDQNGNPVSAASQRKRYIELVNRLGDAGYPPNLIGMQGRPAWINPSEQVAIYDEFAETGIPVSITEFWASTDYLKNTASRQSVESEEWRSIEEKNSSEALNDEQIEKIRDEFVLNYLTCAFGHPNVHSFYFWGFINSSVRFRPYPSASHELSPIYHKVKKLIHEEWNTSLNLKTDQEGKIQFRGFCGNYSARLKPTSEEAIPLGYRFNIDKDAFLNQSVIKTVL